MAPAWPLSVVPPSVKARYLPLFSSLTPELAALWRTYKGRETVREEKRRTCAGILGEVEKIAGAKCAARLSASVLAEAAENG